VDDVRGQMMSRAILVLISLLSGSVVALGQEFLGDVARKAKEEKTARPQSKLVVDDDSEPLKNKSPLPELALHGLDNTDQIIRAIERFKLTHSAEETEEALHEWYDGYDQMMERAIDESKLMKERHISRVTGTRVNATDRINDYRQYEKTMEAERRSDEDDRRHVEANSLLTARIQQAFTQIRFSLQMKQIKYEWFKIRFGNGNGSW
jgi:hypothetical protein